MEDDPHQGFFSRLKLLIKKKTHLGNHTDLQEEIHDLMNEGQARGFISDEESYMVYGVLDLKQTKAQSIMIPRTEISSAALESTLGEVIKLVADCGHTRFPIHNSNIDEIVGILHAKDLLKLWGRGPESKIPRDILRKPYFVPETRRVSELLADLKAAKTHLAIVTDEYGGTAGIITIEDILEEIVGEIQDEHDEEEALLTVIDDHTVLVDARLEVKKLEEYLNVELSKGDFESVGGFVLHLLGTIPEVSEKIEFRDLEITIKEADERRIHKVLVQRKTPPAASEESRLHPA